VWILKYLVCLVQGHLWVGARYHYCLRCGKLEVGPLVRPEFVTAEETAVDFNSNEIKEV
jgi:hypothetical protein